MEKQKKSKVRVLGMKLDAFVQLGAIVGMFITGALYLENRFDEIEDTMNRRFDVVDHRLYNIETRLDNLEGEFHKLHAVVHNYLSWRFLYVNDPQRKDLVPVYDPVNGTMEFIKKSKTN